MMLVSVLLLITLTQAASQWIVSTIQPVESQVNLQTDLQWTLISNEAVSPGDCIQVEIPSPYSTADEVYSSFSFTTQGNMGCEIETDPLAECSILSATKFQILLKAPQSQTQASGRTIGGAFRNPYSARRINRVTVTHLKECSVSLVTARVSFPQFTNGQLDTQKIQIKSSSRLVADTEASLQVVFQPVTNLKPEGRIMVKSPAWYISQGIGQEGIYENTYEGSMINYDSEVVSIKSSRRGTIEVLGSQFDQTAGSLVVEYRANRDLYNSEFLTLTISKFQNPVDQMIVSGFEVSTLDTQGYLIDQSIEDLQLQTQASIPQKLNDIQLKMLGDKNGQFQGQIISLQKFQFSISLDFPLEPLCYFVFQFPRNLKLEKNVQQVSGSGIFQPSSDEVDLSLGEYGQYNVDEAQNTIKIEGCRIPQSGNPYGTVTLTSVLMPDYITQVDPIQVKVYSDRELTNLVVDDPKGVSIDMSELMPGQFEAVLFNPSNAYASAQRVAYTLYVRPQHIMTPETRIVIDMPELLTFNRTEGCQVILTQCNCRIDNTSNALTLTDIFDTDVPGGTLLKFMILSAKNPVGSRPAGAWAIRSEIPVNGNYYIVDSQRFDESFFALSGVILSSLSIDHKQVSSSDTIYTFTLQPEHDIPKQGKLNITFPVQTTLQDVKVINNWFPIIHQEGNKLTLKVVNGSNSDVPIQFNISNIKNVRSMQPSSAFQIVTSDQDDFVIDQGGQDIIVELTEFALLKNVTVTNLNQLNGAVTSLWVEAYFEHPVLANDTLHMELPQDIFFEGEVTCSTSQLEISCSRSERELQVQFNQKPSDYITFTVSGIKNPPSFRATKPFQLIYTTDAEGYKSQKAQDLSLTRLQTSIVANIQDYKLSQVTQEYSQDGAITLQFLTVNPISAQGVIVLKWPASVELYNTTYCKVTTYKQIIRNDLCVFDLDERTLKIQNAFVEVSRGYSGLIQIGLSNVKNPQDNMVLEQFELYTFDDQLNQYAIDYLKFEPILKCVYPCQTCGLTKDFCNSCWHESPSYLQFFYNQDGSCLDGCPSGWTTNGTVTKQCTQCDITCTTCQDEGKKGDMARCLTCAPGFDYFQPNEWDLGVTGLVTGLCLIQCKVGWFDAGDGICKQCDAGCGTCLGNSLNCTSCNSDSDLPALLGNNCIESCPSDHLNTLGVCYLCDSPCATCYNKVSVCSSCDGVMGLKYRFGQSCFSDCPEGTKTDLLTKACIGCKTGCQICDSANPDTCLKCKQEFMTFEDNCYQFCPSGSIVSFSGNLCRRLSELDAKLVYFPFLILTLLVAFVSWVGQRVKRQHLVLTNFLIILGLIEHIALIVQIILTFILGTVGLAIGSVLVWTGFIATQVVFNFLWFRRITKSDERLKAYREHQDNINSTRVRGALSAFANWRFQKLLYSHFFGLHVNAFKFSSPKKVQNLFWRVVLANIWATYVPLLILNAVSLYFVGFWGTQLQIMLIENMTLAGISILFSLVEHRKMSQTFSYQMVGSKEQIKANKKVKDLTWSPFKAMKVLSNRQVFIQKKLDELLYVFGDRECRSDQPEDCEMEADPRIVRSFPLSPGASQQLILVDDPPRPYNPILRDNCYHEAYGEQPIRLFPLSDGIEASTQKGGPYDECNNLLLRADTRLFSEEPDESEFQKQKSKKQRGRRVFYQPSENGEPEIEQTGTVLDLDVENLVVNYKQMDEDLEEISEESEVIPVVPPSISVANKTKFKRKCLKKLQQKKKQHKIPEPDAYLRNFNEIDVLGNVDRDGTGVPFVMMNAEQTMYLDSDDRQVTSQGYLLDEDQHVVQAQNPTVKMFPRLIVPDSLPAPFFFERFNFHPYALFGNFKSYKSNADAGSCVKTKVPEKHQVVDEYKRQVNAEGFLVDKKGNLVNQKGKVIFDGKQLANGCLPQMYNWSGVAFSVTEVMGTFRMNEKNQIQKFAFKKGNHFYYQDLSGHLVNEKGYLINKDGHMVSRKGKIIFLSHELKNGEFPKIFSFSTFDLKLIQGNFKRDTNKKPILQQLPDGSFTDENGLRVTQQGYLLDQNLNITDRHRNVLFENHLLTDQLRLPLIFQKSGVLDLQEAVEDDLSDLLMQIESGGKQTIASLENDSALQRFYNNQDSEMRQFFNSTMRLNASKSVQKVQMNRTGIFRTPVPLVRNVPQLLKEVTFKDISMTQLYGGDPQPRVVGVGAQYRYQTNMRERGTERRGQVLRDSACLSPPNLLYSSQSNLLQVPHAHSRYQQMGRMAYLSQDNVTPSNAFQSGGFDMASVLSASQQAISIKNETLHRMRKKMMFPNKADLLSSDGPSQREPHDDTSNYLNSENYIDYKVVQALEDFSEVTHDSFAQLVNQTRQQMHQPILPEAPLRESQLMIKLQERMEQEQLLKHK